MTNFIQPLEGTSPFGIQLADALAAQLSKGEKPLGVVDRASFKSLLQQERLSPLTQTGEPVARGSAKS